VSGHNIPKTDVTNVISYYEQQPQIPYEFQGHTRRAGLTRALMSGQNLATVHCQNCGCKGKKWLG
jgi:hypothetical protein